MTVLSVRAACFVAGLLVANLSGDGPSPQYIELANGDTAVLPERVYDFVSRAGCAVSADGLVWYRLEAGEFPPLALRFARCSGARSEFDNAHTAERPAWSIPHGKTRALFVAVSLQWRPSPNGMLLIEHAAQTAGVPVTWLIADWSPLTGSTALYQRFHARNGDDVQVAPYRDLMRAARKRLAWYRPAVAIAGPIASREIAPSFALGLPAFWGIAWNSTGIDGIGDLGAPWGTYCADPRAYKRPEPRGTCSLLAMEWTARDLTRAYFTGREAAFSTEPTDVLARAGLHGDAAAAYLRTLVDAYAAAGESQALVVIINEESDLAAAGEPEVPALLAATYARAAGDGMRAATLANAATIARSFSGAPRAVAFPFVAAPAPVDYLGSPLTPATIDFHDRQMAATFVAPRTMPDRVFAYDAAPVPSTRARGLSESDLHDGPHLLKVRAAPELLEFTFDSARAAHWAVALWADPAKLGLAGSNVIPAGRAGAVVVFDLPAGIAKRRLACGRCFAFPLPLAR